MADITMCSGEGCPKRETCYRAQAPEGIRQSWFVEVPLRDGDCRHYWPMPDVEDKVE
jgi:hypothetical protein